MSEPMTNIEIEDVLSSIRRLVADGDQSKAPVAGATPVDAPRKAGKLVLTPSWRVDIPPEPIVLAAESRVDVPKAAVPPHMPPAMQPTVAPTMPPTMAPPVPTGDRVSLLSKVAVLEAAVQAQPDDWEPDGTGTDTDLSWARAGFRGDAEVTDAELATPDAPGDQDTAVTAPADPVGGWPQESWRTAAISDADWPDTLAEAARRYGADDQESDIPVAEFRHHRPDNVARPDPDDSDFNDDLIGGPDLGFDPEDMIDSFLSGDPMIDQAVLRDMVRDIVRQELQGKLGERITRNVRKLVRREIHRVLTTQSFD